MIRPNPTFPPALSLPKKTIMDLPFKKSDGATKDNVGAYNFKLHYPDVNRNMPWSELAPYMRQAVSMYILPYLGEKLWDDITGKIQDPPNGFPDENLKHDKFIERLRDVTAHYTIAYSLPFKKTTVASMGAMTNNPSEGTAVHPLWAFKTTLWQVTQSADRLLDDLLGWMEGQVEQGNQYFIDNWKEEDAYDEIDGFFRHTSDFEKHWPINRSLRAFRKLVPVIRQQAEEHIRPVLCDDQYNSLLDKIRENDTSDQTRNLVERVRTALAALTVSEASRSMPILADNSAFRLISNTDAIDQKSYGQIATQQAIAGIREGAGAKAKRFMDELVHWLYENRDDYPLWRDSPCNVFDNEENGIEEKFLPVPKGGVML